MRSKFSYLVANIFCNRQVLELSYLKIENMKIILQSVFLVFILNYSFGQSISVMGNSKTHRIVNRLKIKYGGEFDLHTSIKPYNLNNIFYNLKNIVNSDEEISVRKNEAINYIVSDNIDLINYISKNKDLSPLSSRIEKKEKGILKYFYKTSSSFLTFSNDDFFIKIDPVLCLNFGKDLENKGNLFENTRGFKISGLLNDKVYFYTSLFETQKSFLTHVVRRISRDKAIPGQGFYKTFNSSVLDGLKGYDFLNAQAYVGFNLTKSISAQFGHGKFFLGNGVRSLFLSDYGHNYFYLNFDTKIWKFHYKNIFAELAANGHLDQAGDKIIPKKYMAVHYLSFDVFKNFQVGLFETVILSRDNGFELQYLNPVILYRTVEHFVGSPDNVLVGLDLKYDFLNKFSIYGQILLDEFNFKILKEDATWWANKYGLQLGLKYIDVFGIEDLDFNYEYNIVRPYTYSHREKLTTYSHFNQPLAHPLGANFRENIFVLNYSPSVRFNVEAKALYAMQGEDFDEYSQGGNILRSYNLRPVDSDGKRRDYGYKIGNGLKRSISQLSLKMSYMFLHNYNLDFMAVYRNEVSENKDLNLKEFYFGGGVSINFDYKNLDY